MRRAALAAGLLLAIAVSGALALRSMAGQPGGASAGTTAGSRRECAPQPCADPHEFELHLTRGAAHPNDRHLLRLEATFRNAHYDSLSMNGNQDRADLADFQLRDGRGTQTKPVFDAPGCEEWAATKMYYRQGFGPRAVCFRVEGPAPLQVVWGPDLGLLFDDVRIPLPGTWFPAEALGP
ncbi:MAG: hypothetical protein M3010_00165 [Candidatus Dormibacteraeota bacterium]|nr:hypothetical protein [Candidatus Dormibacteraeota bacterium]